MRKDFVEDLIYFLIARFDSFLGVGEFIAEDELGLFDLLIPFWKGVVWIQGQSLIEFANDFGLLEVGFFRAVVDLYTASLGGCDGPHLLD